MFCKLLFLTSLFLGYSLAFDEFFGNVKRAEIFEKTDFKVPNIIINLSDEDYRRFFLTYQCDYDMNIRHAVRNEDCYNAPWFNLDDAMKNAFKYEYIDKSKLSSSDLEIIEKKGITLSQFENIVTKYTNFTLETILSTSYGLYTIPKYETEEASLTFDLDGEITEVPSIKLKVGGRSTVRYEKLGFNIKIQEGTLFGRKQLRLRTEVADPSFMRDKLMYDMANALELPCLSLNYAKVFFNERFMGFYAMRDAYKSHWIKSTFGEKNTKHLYECDPNFGSNQAFNCRNADEELSSIEDADYKNFIKSIDNAKTKEDLAEFFDVETYLKWQAIKYLIGGWDHVTKAQNIYLYMYRDPTTFKSIWIPLVYDFDNDFGAYGYTSTTHTFKEAVYSKEKSNPLYIVLGITAQASPEVLSYMEQIMKRFFNPKFLFDRIDQLREFLDPYMKEDRTFDENGNRPGRMRRNYARQKDYFTYEDFLNNSEYTSITINRHLGNGVIDSIRVHGLKEWIIERFRTACSTYDIDCSYAQEYLNDFEYKKEHIYREEFHHGCHDSDYECCIKPNPEVKSITEVGQWGREFGYWCLIDNDEDPACWSLKEGYPCCEKESTKFSYYNGRPYGVENGGWCGVTELQINYYNSQNNNSSIIPVRTASTATIKTTTSIAISTTTTSTTTTSTTETNNSIEITISTETTNTIETTNIIEVLIPTNTVECWSLKEGYPCCEKIKTEIKSVSKDGERQYGVENGQWCGITSLQLDYIAKNKDCWSFPEGYPCCENKDTPVSSQDKQGRPWGVENKEWCGITDIQLNN